MRTDKPLKTQKTPAIQVGGAFECETCADVVDEAEYYRPQQLLVWECENGHLTRLEKFNI